MVTVREQLPERLSELAEETTVEHAEKTQLDLAAWVKRVGDILDGAELKQLEKVAQLTLKSELESTVNHPSNTFTTGIG
ncbi:UNVERIFIED_CONTAM: bifunctional (p)ppGpp synthetase/guanosine-3',5'-bis(diphosphate) 3'-pyrophosphohydrolase, partial [Serratia marcescens]